MYASRLLVVGALVGCAGAGVPSPVGDGDAKEDLAGERVDRARWVRAEIDRWNSTLDAAGRAEKYAVLAESPLSFFRGTNHLFWHDVDGSADLGWYGGGRTETWIQGDCHVENFGSFDDDEGEIVYGPNDFDDAWVADYQLDVWRLATSLVLFSQENDGDAEEAVDAMAGAYLDAMAGFRGNDSELGLQFDAGATSGAIKDLLEDAEEDDSPAKLLKKWTTGEGAARRFDTAGNPDLGPVTAAEAARVRAAVAGGAPVRDVARRLHAGTSSLGVVRYYVLLGEDVILDVKAARRSPGQAYVGGLVGDNAAIAAEGQRALGKDVDDRLASVTIGGGAYLVRTLSPWKEDLSAKKLVADLPGVAAQWGRMLAAAHARGDKDYDAEMVGVSIDKEIGVQVDGDEEGWRDLVWTQASRLARQTVRDHAAWSSGR